MAHESGQEFRPYIAPEQNVPEFTLKAIVLGVFFGILFGAATVYLALRAGPDGLGLDPDRGARDRGLQEARQVHDPREQHRPDDRLGRRVGRGRRRLHPPGPALPRRRRATTSSTVRSTILAIFGGILGVLFMIPLRRALIVKEHGKLPYPEGTACADVLIAGEKGGNLAKMVFAGVGIALLYKFLYGILGLWQRDGDLVPDRRRTSPSIRPRRSTCDVTPEYLGVGYIIGPRIAGELVSGGVLVLAGAHPADRDLRAGDARRRRPEERSASPTPGWRNNSYANWIYRAYVRYIGAGRGGGAGRHDAHQDAADDRRRPSASPSRASASGRRRRPRRSAPSDDLGMGIVIFGSLAIVLVLAILPGFPHGPFGARS